MLAGLPKAPSAYNPVANPKRARTRQLYVLRRMHDLRFITDAQFKEAQDKPLVVQQTQRDRRLHADYIAEMARQAVFEAYGEDGYTRGLTVYTTIRKAEQDAAYAAVRRGVLDYDRRHGYRGPEAFVSLPTEAAELEQALDKAFQDTTDVDDLLAAVVLEASPTEVKAVLQRRRRRHDHAATGSSSPRVRLATRRRPTSASGAARVIRVSQDDKGHWQIAQMPQVEAAFVSARPSDGAIRSLVGGFDFDRNKFNHVTQAQRQPGSSFKPFIYSAALEKGFSPATVVNDAPLYFDAAQTGGDAWEPKNYDGKFEGPMRLRTALMKSKNLVTVRVLQAIGPQYAQDYITRFGFDPKLHPPYLPMAPGRGHGDAVADGGGLFGVRQRRLSRHALPHRPRRRQPRQRAVEGGSPRWRATMRERAIDPRNAFIMTTHDARRGARRHRGARDAARAHRTSPARRARPTRASTPGSAASTPAWSASRGSASTSRARWARTKPAASRRCRSG